jgi:hypothetical protein
VLPWSHHSHQGITPRSDDLLAIASPTALTVGSGVLVLALVLVVTLTGHGGRRCHR